MTLTCESDYGAGGTGRTSAQLREAAAADPLPDTVTKLVMDSWKNVKDGAGKNVF